MTDASSDPLAARLVDALYTEAMLLADEARSYFDGAAQRDRSVLDPLARVGFACESLRVTTRLMHVVAWLLARREEGARESGVRPSAHRLGEASPSGEDAVAGLPEAARALIAASQDLHARIGRLEAGGAVRASPARALMRRLEEAV